MADLEEARKLLRDRFGFADFLPGQAAALQAALDGEDLFVLAPTGAGKSLIYQLPALIRPGLTLVVSPLVALMRDQTRRLEALGLPAAALHGETAPGAWRRARNGLESGRLRLLYLAPERLADPETLALLREANPRALAVDEAHCVSQWGHDFRPDYRRIADFAASLSAPQVIAATATASPRTRADIVENLFARPPRQFVGSLRRPAIALSALPRQRDSMRQLIGLVAARRGGAGVIYCRARETADRVAAALKGAGLPASSYHAGLPTALRAARQDEFLARSDLTMAATIAFGLGVDKPDARFVIHYDTPDDPETLYQETGRAGRDGRPAEAIALYAPERMAQLRAARFDLARLDAAAGEKARALSDYFLKPACREQTLLRALGEQAPPCGRCDNCRVGRPAHRALRLAGAAPRGVFDLARDVLRSGLALLLPPPAPIADLDAPAASSDAWTLAAKKLSVVEARRLELLRATRLALARKAGLAPGRIIGAEALVAIAVSPPRSLAELVETHGDPSGLLARHGQSLIDATIAGNG
ncbi:RecQ family ATP-dependent DNA helicase [Rhodoblastus sp.]|uniref:RecQ family ATP-dependent DNA helicase n=1 Tax=Rhodoblastus sp. TaxID=1962975 RepID=UPI00260F1E1D|nr:RecQ family ATP-dependent DNA helicase [Rhodoblastus sp.]